MVCGSDSSCWHAGPNLCGRPRLNLAHHCTTHLAFACQSWMSLSQCICVCLSRLLVSGGPVPGAGASLCWSHGVSPGQSTWSCHSRGLCSPQTSQLPASLAYSLQWKRSLEILETSLQSVFFECNIMTVYKNVHMDVSVQGLGSGQLLRLCVWVWDTGNLRD